MNYKHIVTGYIVEPFGSGYSEKTNGLYFPKWCIENSKDWIKNSFAHITEDGIGLNYGDKAYLVCKYYSYNYSNNFYVYQYGFNFLSYHIDLLKDPKYKLFSTEQAAKDFCEKSKPKPIFITKDNVEIFYKETIVYGVCFKSAWETNKHIIGNLVWKEGINPTPAWLWFSTSENRDNYKKENQPRFSEKDVESVFGMDCVNKLIKYGNNKSE